MRSDEGQITYLQLMLAFLRRPKEYLRIFMETIKLCWLPNKLHLFSCTQHRL